MNEYIIGYFFLLILIQVIRYFTGQQRLRKEDIVLKGWENVLSKIDSVLIALIILVFYGVTYRLLHMWFYATLSFVLYTGVVVLVASRLLVSRKGFYYRGVYTSWRKVKSIILINKTTLRIERIGLFYKYIKIKDMKNKEAFIAIAKEECLVDNSSKTIGTSL